MTAQTVRVELAGDGGRDRSYDITVGQGILANVGTLLADAGCRRAVAIADAAVVSSHAEKVVTSLQAAGI